MPPGDKKWDMAAERDLSVAIILANNDGKPSYNWPKVYSIMESIGYSFTKDAISQHFTKVVMKDFKARNGDISKGGSATSTPTKAKRTPTKRKATPAKSYKSPEYVDADDDDDEEDTAGPPPKKSKAESDDESATVKEEQVPSRARSQTLGHDDAGFQKWLAERKG